MNLPDLKQLKAIIALCRKSGVESIEIEGIKITLKDMPASSKPLKAKESPKDNSSDSIESDDLTNEQLLNWSVPDFIGAPKADESN